MRTRRWPTSPFRSKARAPTRPRRPRSPRCERDVVPETVGALPDAEAGVTGLTAAWIDSKNEVKSELPLVIAFVLALAFVLMLFAFRSLVIAAKAIVLNLLSVAASYGVLVLVFQNGYGKDLVGFSSTARDRPGDPAAPVRDPLRLSMDYHVFILSRIREAFHRGSGATRRSRTGSSRLQAWSRAPRSSWSSCSRSSRRSR